MTGFASAALDVRSHLLLVAGMAAALVGMHWAGALVLLAAVLAYHIYRGRDALRSLGRGVWRLKWLLVAIAGIYYWFPHSEGEPLWLAPVERGLILVTMLASVHSLLFRFEARALGDALGEWLVPLEWLWLPGRDFARRLAHVLDNVLGADLRPDASAPMARGSWWSWVPRRLAAEIETIEARAARDEPSSRSAAGLPPTPLWQWLLVLALLSGILGLRVVLP